MAHNLHYIRYKKERMKMKKIEVYNENKQTIGFIETEKNILDSRKMVMEYFPNCGSMNPNSSIPKHNPRCKKIADGVFSWEMPS
jgi:hypothetical protein